VIHVVLGIIQRDDKVLMAKRPAHKPYPNYWEFPGGKVEQTESPTDALQRELKEELNIKVMTTKAWLQYQHAYSQDIFLLDVYQVLHFLDEPIAQENQLINWVSLSDIKQLSVLAGNQLIIEQLIKESR